MYESELKISGVGLPIFSSRNCRQVLMPLTKKLCHRTINGVLVYTGRTTHHKYASRIVGEDRTTPALFQQWIGSDVMVSCIQAIWEEGTVDGQGCIKLGRPCVPDSVKAYDETGSTISFAVLDTRTIQTNTNTLRLQIQYNPILSMKMMSFDFMVQEWSQTSTWVLELEEV